MLTSYHAAQLPERVLLFLLLRLEVDQCWTAFWATWGLHCAGGVTSSALLPASVGGTFLVTQVTAGRDTREQNLDWAVSMSHDGGCDTRGQNLRWAVGVSHDGGCDMRGQNLCCAVGVSHDGKL